jgi:hypothetical protein
VAAKHEGANCRISSAQIEYMSLVATARREIASIRANSYLPMQIDRHVQSTTPEHRQPVTEQLLGRKPARVTWFGGSEGLNRQQQAKLP